jgi:tetrahydromethanopterin S-methyltransferase subunit D
MLTAACFAQENKPEMADVMRSNGKIYVVVAVCLTILVGLFIYVFMLDRKISRLEKGKD